MCYSTDSTGHIHLSAKASHHASKAAVDYYNASFLDVSPRDSSYQIHWLPYSFAHFSRGRNSVNKEDGVICLSHYVILCGQCSRHNCSGVCLAWHIAWSSVQCVAICQQGTMLFCNLFTVECSCTHVHEVFNHGWHVCIVYIISFFARATLFQRPSLLLSLQWATPRVTSGSLCGSSALLPLCSWPTSWRGCR